MQSPHAELEREVLVAIATARADPKAVAARLKRRRSHFKGKEYFAPERGGKHSVVTKEGVAVLDEAIKYLEKLKVVTPMLTENLVGLRLAAEDHVHDIGTVGTVSHTGSDESSAGERSKRYGQWHGHHGEVLWYGKHGDWVTGQEIIDALIIDDGVESRGHRLGVFNGDYEVAGCAIADHSTFGAMCAVEMATSFDDDSDLVEKRLVDGPPKIEHSIHKKVETQWKLGTCGVCGEGIAGGTVVTLPGLGKIHAKCFNCCTCGTELSGQKFKIENGKIYREQPCWAKEFGPKCHGCGEPILEGKTLFDKQKNAWHEACAKKPKPKAKAGPKAMPKAGGGKRRSVSPAPGKARGGMGGMMGAHNSMMGMMDDLANL
jgi:uncharacterized protein YkwD